MAVAQQKKHCSTPCSSRIAARSRCASSARCKRLGIRSVAVYSDADAGAPHVALADVAVRIGPAPATESYLSIDAVLAAAAATGAQAIHPGYGFLSENAAFARACADGRHRVHRAGRARARGDGRQDPREAARRRAAACRWCRAADAAGLDDAALTTAAAGRRLPAAHQAVRGRRRQGDADRARGRRARPPRSPSARRIASAAFGDDTLLLERLIERPRHIEVQVLADRAGTTIHLGERECSLQRRHQKVIEEAPSPLLDAATRARIGEAACEVARSVQYEGAGTVEFLVADAAPDEFFFIEMNTRLQVEHPVTELVTGVDLVEQQLRIAAGEPLALAQDDIRLHRARDRGPRLRRVPGPRLPPGHGNGARAARARRARASASTAASSRGSSSAATTTRCSRR